MMKEAIKNPEIIKELSSEYGCERICVSLDSKNNKVVTHGWKESTDKTPIEYAKLFEKMGAGSILFTNVDVEGLLNGINLEPIKELLNNVSIPIKYSGFVNFNMKRRTAAIAVRPCLCHSLLCAASQ